MSPDRTRGTACNVFVLVPARRRWQRPRVAQIDDQRLQITIGVVGVGSAAVDLLVHQGRKLGLDRELLEAVPVVRFGLRAEVLGRPLVVVMSAAPLDVFQADAVIAVDTGRPGLEALLDRFDLMPIAAANMTMERLSGAGREHDPLQLVLHTGATRTKLPGFDSAVANLETGEGISAAINPLVSRAAGLLANGERIARECPTLILHASHHPTSSTDLQPGAFPRPGARIALGVSLHEPFGEEDRREWSCEFVGAVEALVDAHTVQGTVDPVGPVPAELQGRWQVELIREHEIWFLRSMVRAG